MKVLVSLLLIAVVASVSHAGVQMESVPKLHHQNTLSLNGTVGDCDVTTNCIGGTCCSGDCFSGKDDVCCPNGKACAADHPVCCGAGGCCAAEFPVCCGIICCKEGQQCDGAKCKN